MYLSNALHHKHIAGVVLIAVTPVCSWYFVRKRIDHCQLFSGAKNLRSTQLPQKGNELPDEKFLWKNPFKMLWIYICPFRSAWKSIHDEFSKIFGKERNCNRLKEQWRRMKGIQSNEPGQMSNRYWKLYIVIHIYSLHTIWNIGLFQSSIEIRARDCW